MVAIEIVPAEVSASGQGLRQRRGEAERLGDVESLVAKAVAVLDEAVIREPRIRYQSWREVAYPVHYVGVVDSLEGLLAVLAGTADDTVNGPVLGAIVGSVAEKKTQLVSDVLIELQTQ